MPLTGAGRLFDPQYLGGQQLRERRAELFPLQRSGEIYWNNASPRPAENLHLAQYRRRLKSGRRSHQDQLAGAPKSPGADLFPVVSRGVIVAIQKDLEAFELQPTGESVRVGGAIAPCVGDEKIIAEYEIERRKGERPFWPLATSDGGCVSAVAGMECSSQ